MSCPLLKNKKICVFSLHQTCRDTERECLCETVTLSTVLWWHFWGGDGQWMSCCELYTASGRAWSHRLTDLWTAREKEHLTQCGNTHKLVKTKQKTDSHTWWFYGEEPLFVSSYEFSSALLELGDERVWGSGLADELRLAVSQSQGTLMF